MSKLTEKYCIVGIGETSYTRGTESNTRTMAVEVVKKAAEDAGLKASEIDGMLTYMVGGDSVSALPVASDLGIRLNYYMDVWGGGSTCEALVGLAIGAMEVGMCNTVAIFRSMLGFSGIRGGGSAALAGAALSGPDLLERTYGLSTPGQMFAPYFMRYMMEYGVTSSQVANVKAVQSSMAGANPKAFYKQKVTVEDVLNSRWIVKPLHLLDCCVETDNATAFIITSAERARNLKQKPIHIMGVAGRTCKIRANHAAAHAPLTRVAGYYARNIVFPMAGIVPEDVDITAAYDAFTFTTVMQLEDYGFCPKGEGGSYVTSGIIELGGKRPNNTSGGQLCEGYSNGMNLVIENVRQLRGQADDYCPGWCEGKHSYNYLDGGCRQVRYAEIAMNMGWGGPGIGSALILRK